MRSTILASELFQAAGLPRCRCTRRARQRSHCPLSSGLNPRNGSANAATRRWMTESCAFPRTSLMPRKYRPSNGTEGEGFYENWCLHCTKDAAFRENPDSGDGCPIAASTYVFNIDDPLYPTEWIEDD